MVLFTNFPKSPSFTDFTTRFHTCFTDILLYYVTQTRTCRIWTSRTDPFWARQFERMFNMKKQKNYFRSLTTRFRLACSPPIRSSPAAPGKNACGTSWTSGRRRQPGAPLPDAGAELPGRGPGAPLRPACRGRGPAGPSGHLTLPQRAAGASRPPSVSQRGLIPLFLPLWP